MDRILDEDDLADIDDALKLKEKWDKHKEEKDRRRQTQELEAYQQREIARQELAKRWALIEQSLEKARLEYLEKASVEALMAVVKDPVQLAVLYKRGRLQTLANLPPDRVLAILMEDGTLRGEAAREMMLAVQSGKTAEYEKFIADLKQSLDITREQHDQHIRTLTGLFTSVLDRMPGKGSR